MKPLEGITILEFSTMITAALASMMLAEQGARVIKVEPTDAGIPCAISAPARGYFVIVRWLQPGQGIDQSRPQKRGRASRHPEMIPHVDVVIHNFRPGTMETLNLDFKTLQRLNSRLIYMAISGFGTEGPLRRAPAYDPIIQAQCGMAATQGSDESPTFIRSLLCDKITGYTACQAVTSALFARERTGNGQIIDLSMLDSGCFYVPRRLSEPCAA
ncbi:MAG: hypothetical protein CM15mP74_15860 [Halieaceae bacterium]|nr:MAG: hypothetical protein CM15mP74_15860 [Halieaceae bacterium]